MPKLPFGFATPQQSPGFLLWQTTMLWQRRIKKALEPHQVTHAQFVIMATLLWFSAHGHETTQAFIIEWTKLDKMTVSKSLKELALVGLVVRSEHHTDTRAKTVELTKKGGALVHKLVPIVESIDSDFFKTASTAEQKNLIAIFAQLTKEDHE